MENATATFFDELGRPFTGDEIFDAIPDTVFFIKDRECKYVTVNSQLVKRSGFAEKTDLIGRTAVEIFPTQLGSGFAAQDQQVISTGEPVCGELELHLYPGGSEGWCLTWKTALANVKGETIGLSGISRDVSSRTTSHKDDLDAVSQILNHIRDHLSGPLSPAELAEMAGFSSYQLDRRICELFGVSTAQYITRNRIELARHKLAKTDTSISHIAVDCGYSDQSSFTRQFRQSVGSTPKAYREAFGGPGIASE